ncbi:MAG: outer membrane beta-barrel protein [Chitinophagaceae bacterium]|jgi:hypothetical protein
MRKLVIIILLSSFSSFSSKAQTLKIGLELGPSVNLANEEVVRFDHMSISNTKQLRIAARVGIPVQIKITKGFKINSGIYYAMKGGMHTSANSSIPSISYSSLEVPLIFTFSRFDETRNSFFIGAGPYLGVGISGNLRVFGMKRKVNWGYENPTADMQRLEYGAQLQMGVEFRNKWFCRFVAQHTLNNLAADEKTIFGGSTADHKFYKISSMAYASFTVGYYLFSH